MNELKNPAAYASTMKLIGDYWILAIISALNGKEMRFCELQRQLGNVNPVTLTSRLKKLEDEGIVSREEEDKQCVTYGLTNAGQRYQPVIDAIRQIAA